MNLGRAVDVAGNPRNLWFHRGTSNRSKCEFALADRSERIAGGSHEVQGLVAELWICVLGLSRPHMGSSTKDKTWSYKFLFRSMTQGSCSVVGSWQVESTEVEQWLESGRRDL